MDKLMEGGKISAFQMGILMAPTIIATAILSAPAVTARVAGRDMWMSPIWASLLGFIAIYLACKLNKIYPAETIIEYSERIIGRLGGKLIGAVFLLFYLHLNGEIMRQYGEFILETFLTKTPISFVIGSMVLLSAFAVYGGIEVLGRCAQIMVPVVVFFYFVIIVLLIPDLQLRNMLPLMEDGMSRSMIGALIPQGWYSEFFMISFMLPYLSNRSKALKWSAISVIFVLFILLLSNLATLLLFGQTTEAYTYPVLIAARYINLADFFQHVESIVMAIWVTGMFIKISVFYYVLCIGTAQWLKLSDYKPIVFPLGLLILAFTMWAAPNNEELLRVLGTTSPFYSTSIQVGIPLLLLLFALVRTKNKQAKGESGNEENSSS